MRVSQRPRFERAVDDRGRANPLATALPLGLVLWLTMLALWYGMLG